MVGAIEFHAVEENEGLVHVSAAHAETRAEITARHARMNVQCSKKVIVDEGEVLCIRAKDQLLGELLVENRAIRRYHHVTKANVVVLVLGRPAEDR
jgi:hypothetical protein